MKRSRFILLIIFIFIALSGKAEVRLPKFISDGMVLQRQSDVKIWGWAGDNEKIAVQFIGKTFQTEADASGKWNIVLPPLKAGGPYDMTITGKNTIVIKNILVGDVWLCSGQSNMEITMERVSPLYPEEIKNAGNKSIRYFAVPKTYNFQAPQSKLKSGRWISPNPSNILDFSAVSYFFAKALYDSLQVPVGVINSALGGSPVEAWIDIKTLKKFPKYDHEALRFQSQQLIDSIQKADQARSHHWYSELQAKDLGYQNPSKTWRNPNLNTSSWATMNLPAFWADTPLGKVNGVVWFRKVIDVPAAMAGKPAKLLMGRIVDADSVFVNGTFVGTTSYQYPPRRYEIPAHVLKAGKNSIVVAVRLSKNLNNFVDI